MATQPSSLARLTLAVICLGSFALMYPVSRSDSAIADEIAHIPAGYGYVNQLDYRLNPEHPPLVKALAMLPVLLLRPDFPTNNPAWTKEVNGEADMGQAFLYQSGNDANAIIRTARIVPMLLTVVTIVAIWFFARGLMGDQWALVPAFLAAFDPLFLAHGHYVTTDVGAALGVLLSLFFFLKFVHAPTTKNLWWAGLAFGIGQIAKFSMPVETIVFVFLTLVLCIQDRMRGALGRFGKLFLIFLIGYVFVCYPAYFVFTLKYPIARQVSDTMEILRSFAGGGRFLADLDIRMAGNPVARPLAQYFLGLLMTLQRTSAGSDIYFLGSVVNSGGWIYFPVLFLFQPIPLLIVIFFALALAARNRTIVNSFAELSLVSFIVIYWAVSMLSPLNIGIRHILPTLPPIYILSAGIWKKWIATASFRNAAVKCVFLFLLLAWLLVETLFAAPYFLSYFNEFGGGVWNGYRYASNSNYDWGQDLLRLQSFVAAHPAIDRIAVDYSGGGNPQYYLGSKEVDWWSSMGDPASQGIDWLAVSVRTLQLATQPLGRLETRDPEDAYSWLTALRPPKPGMGNLPPPDYRAGTSIFIYHLHKKQQGGKLTAR